MEMEMMVMAGEKMIMVVGNKMVIMEMLIDEVMVVDMKLMVVAKVKLVVRRYDSGGDDHGGVVDPGGDWLWL